MFISKACIFFTVLAVMEKLANANVKTNILTKIATKVMVWKVMIPSRNSRILLTIDFKQLSGVRL